MLVLTRKVGEGIAIGDDIKIVVMQIKGKQVRLGIKASSQTVVHREEVYQRIQDENQEATTANLSSVNEAGELLGETPEDIPSARLRKQVRSQKK